MGRLLVAQLVQGSWSAGQETAFGVGVRDICGGSVLFLHHRQLFLVLGFERLVKQKFVSSELEIEIETVHDQQQDRGSSGDFQDFGVQVFCLSWKRCMEGGREQQSTHRQRKQRAHCLSHCLVERLLWVLDTTGDETTSKHQQEVGKNRAKHGSLHNGYLVLTQGQNAHNNFNCISESSV
ncbi:hypothetical protein OGAPHI_005064 [Ogataea philodendri]|uniref:Uncharacterized protein n=1 Tax=Ogataea philodendri TaxID=1378263 RepID=A0A9P8T2A7_9ASCO|nr:uncharacterized protein OGAPHI_005064 [Ogataea philodendri]KAH3663663.1 hypothetical protein OGAPHI_005064 [Ogataea philodendri]